jgi:hypothetical protein
MNTMTKGMREKLLKLVGYYHLINRGDCITPEMEEESKQLRQEVYKELKSETIIDDLSLLAGAGLLAFTHIQDPREVTFEAESAIFDDDTNSIHLLNFQGWREITNPPPVITIDEENTSKDYDNDLPN